MLDLQPIKDRLAAAAPGPWHQDEDNWWGIRDKDEEIVAEAILVHKTREANAELIANAPSDLTALVAEVERLRALLDQANKDMPSIPLLQNPLGTIRMHMPADANINGTGIQVNTGGGGGRMKPPAGGGESDARS